MNEILRTQDLTKIYMLGKIPVRALNNLSFQVERGEFVSIVGPSGSGKTTLLSLIGCLERPTKGSVYIEGVEVTQAKEKDLPKIRREKIGFVFQHFNLLPTLTALGNVEIAMRFSHVSKKDRLERARELIREMGLEERMEHRPSELSGGEQQRVSIARALANRPAIILADEPTGDVDTKTRDHIVGILKGLSEKDQTVLVVTHDPEVAKHATRRITMRDGMIAEDTKQK